MKTKKKIIMLPSESGIIQKYYDELHYRIHKESKKEISQHLYVLSDEEIKEGEYTIYGGKVIKWSYTDEGGWNKDIPKPRKIIATTDADINNSGLQNGKLYMVGVEGTKFEDLRPKQIPQHIIEAYVKKPFDKVMVEVEKVAAFEQRGLPSRLKVTQIKTDSNNCITIHPVEEKMYSREEIMKAWNDSRIVNTCDGDFDIMDDLENKRGDLSDPIAKYTFDKWIKENL